jgi:hypothetical protein
MSYIGNTPANQNFVAGADQFSGTGSQLAFTLSRNVNTVFDMFVTVSNVPQDPFTAYTVAGNTLTFDSAPPSGTNNIDVVYRATNVQTFVPSPGVSAQFGLGSAAAPSMTFIGDTNTGIFSPGADTLAFVEGGTEAMRIDSSANVGIGTSSPSSKLHVAGGSGSTIRNTASAGSSWFVGSNVDSYILHNESNTPMLFTTNGTERARIDSSGNLQLSTAGTKVLNSSGRPILNQTGSILQVVQAYKTDTQTISSATPTFVDITGLSVTITPASSSSRFLIMWSVVMGGGTDATHGYVRLNRNGTAIALADAASNRTTASSGVVNTAVAGQTIPSTNSYLDSPATASAITYKLTASNNNVGGSSTFINRSSRDTDLTGYDGRSTSNITVLEIAG